MRTVILAVVGMAGVAIAEPAETDADVDSLLSQERQCAKDDWRACQGLRLRIGDEPTATRDRYRKTCNRGDAAACAFLGDWIFEHGWRNDGRPDPETSVAWYRKSCRAKSNYGCDRLAWKLGESRETTALHERLCDAGWARSCVTFGERLDTRNVKPAVKRRAIAAFTRGCDGGDVAGCWRAGGALAHLADATVREREESWTRMDAACMGGDASNCRVLRDIFTCGRGTPCDAKRARPYADRAHELDPTDGYHSSDPTSTRVLARCTCQKP